jgi:hypothetical protein
MIFYLVGRMYHKSYIPHMLLPQPGYYTYLFGLFQVFKRWYLLECELVFGSFNGEVPLYLRPRWYLASTYEGLVITCPSYRISHHFLNVTVTPAVCTVLHLHRLWA